MRNCTLDFNFDESIKAKQALKGFFTCRIIIRHGRIRFCAGKKPYNPLTENPPTWVGVEPVTLGAEGQLQTNHGTQPARSDFSYHTFALILNATQLFWKK
ncbi:hypothetical protein TNCV_3015791 [Trichonephila clavipes]|nr:hypothetical protein TNCV_3015791 [Trichonephila clavipes]